MTFLLLARGEFRLHVPYLMHSCQHFELIRMSLPPLAPLQPPTKYPRPHLQAKAPGVEPLCFQKVTYMHYDPAATMTTRSSAALTMVPASTQTLTHLPRTGEQILSSILFDSIQA